MGLYTGRQIFTATSAVNLAGDREKRSNFRKSTVVSSVLSGAREGIGKGLTNAYMTGPGMRLRQFHRWALSHYGGIGVPYETRLNILTVVANDIRPLIQSELLPGEEVAVQGIEILEADYQYFAEQFMWKNYPAKMTELWTASMDEVTGVITINQGPTVVDSFTPVDFDRDSLYLYAPYKTTNANGIFIYRFGSGDPTLDALIEENLQESKAYFPVIPVRLENEFVSDTHKSDIYALAKRAFKKATGADFSEIVKAMEENTNELQNMDYAYVVFGASVTSQIPSQLEYIFDWLKEIGQETGFDTPASAYSGWKNNVTTYTENVEWWYTYEEAPPDGSPEPPAEPPGYPPGVNPATGPDGSPSRPYRGVHIRSPGPLDVNYDTRITWGAIGYTTGVSGLGKPDAVPGDYWWAATTDGTNYRIISAGGPVFEGSDRKDYVVRLYHQISETEYEYLTLTGMEQRTYVFGNHYEALTLYDALTREGVDESSFIIPLRYSTLANMSLATATEFALHCQYLTVHVYEIHTQSFFQTFVPILLIVVVVAVTASTGGFGGSAIGILGSNAAVGAAVGASVATAALIGFVINTLAAMVLTAIIQKAAIEVFGAKLGAVIGTFIAVLTINGLTNLAESGKFAINFGVMSRAENLMMLTNTAGQAFQQYVAADIMQTIEATNELLEDYNEQSREISELYATNIGYDRGMINPFDLVDAANVYVETPSVFLERTLMTGSDIAELSMSMLSNFADISLSTNLPLQ